MSKDRGYKPLDADGIEHYKNYMKNAIKNGVNEYKKNWDDFSPLKAFAVARGKKEYDGYLKILDAIKPTNHDKRRMLNFVLNMLNMGLKDLDVKTKQIVKKELDNPTISVLGYIRFLEKVIGKKIPV